MAETDNDEMPELVSSSGEEEDDNDDGSFHKHDGGSDNDDYEYEGGLVRDLKNSDCPLVTVYAAREWTVLNFKLEAERVVKIKAVSPFLFGQVCQPDELMQYAFDTQLLRDRMVMPDRNLSEEEIKSTNLIIGALDVLFKFIKKGLKKMSTKIHDALVCYQALFDLDGHTVFWPVDGALQIANLKECFSLTCGELRKLFPNESERRRRVSLLLCLFELCRFIFVSYVKKRDLVKEFVEECQSKVEYSAVWKKKGNEAFKNEEFQKACTSYSRAIIMNPYGHLLYGNRAQARLKISDYHGAYLDGWRATILKPDYAKGYYRYSDALIKLGELKKALDVINLGMRLCKDSKEKSNLESQRKKVRDLQKSGKTSVIKAEFNSVSSNAMCQTENIKLKDVSMQLQKDKSTDKKEKEINKPESKLSDYTLLAARASHLLKDSKAKMAVAAFQECLDFVRETTELQLEMTDKIILKYAYGAACIAAHELKKTQDAVKLFSHMLNECGMDKFPIIYYGLAQACFTLNRFDDALLAVNKGLKLEGGVHHWPGTEEIIEYTYPGKLKEGFNELFKLCKFHPKPDAVCLYYHVSDLQAEIYFSDLGFAGFVRVICRAMCHVDFHSHCWKQFRIKHKGDMTSEKDILNRTCFTPDCVADIIHIIVFGSDKLVYREYKSDPAIKPIKAKRPNIKKRPSSVKTIEKRLAKKIARKNAQMEIRQQKFHQTLCEELDAVEAELEEKPTESEKQQKIVDKEPEIDPKDLKDCNFVLLKKDDDEDDDEERAKMKELKKLQKRKKKGEKYYSLSLDEFRGPEYAPPNPPTWLGAESAELPENHFESMRPLLDPESPFVIPEHLRPDVGAMGDFDRNQWSTNSSDTEQERRVKENLYSYIEDLLEANGPVHYDDPLWKQELCTFPKEAIDLIKKYGSLSDFLLKSLHFAIIEDHICLLKDSIKARELAAQRKNLTDDPTPAQAYAVPITILPPTTVIHNALNVSHESHGMDELDPITLDDSKKLNDTENIRFDNKKYDVEKAQSDIDVSDTADSSSLEYFDLPPEEKIVVTDKHEEVDESCGIPGIPPFPFERLEAQLVNVTDEIDGDISDNDDDTGIKIPLYAQTNDSLCADNDTVQPPDDHTLRLAGVGVSHDLLSQLKAMSPYKNLNGKQLEAKNADVIFSMSKTAGFVDSLASSEFSKFLNTNSKMHSTMTNMAAKLCDNSVSLSEVEKSNSNEQSSWEAFQITVKNNSSNCEFTANVNNSSWELIGDSAIVHEAIENSFTRPASAVGNTIKHCFICTGECTCSTHKGSEETYRASSWDDASSEKYHRVSQPGDRSTISPISTFEQPAVNVDNFATVNTCSTIAGTVDSKCRYGSPCCTVGAHIEAQTFEQNRNSPSNKLESVTNSPSHVNDISDFLTTLEEYLPNDFIGARTGGILPDLIKTQRSQESDDVIIDEEVENGHTTHTDDLNNKVNVEYAAGNEDNSDSRKPDVIHSIAQNISDIAFDRVIKICKREACTRINDLLFLTLSEKGLDIDSWSSSGKSESRVGIENGVSNAADIHVCKEVVTEKIIQWLVSAAKSKKESCDYFNMDQDSSEELITDSVKNLLDELVEVIKNDKQKNDGTTNIFKYLEVVSKKVEMPEIKSDESKANIYELFPSTGTQSATTISQIHQIMKSPSNSLDKLHKLKEFSPAVVTQEVTSNAVEKETGANSRNKTEAVGAFELERTWSMQMEDGTEFEQKLGDKPSRVLEMGSDGEWGQKEILLEEEMRDSTELLSCSGIPDDEHNGLKKEQMGGVHLHHRTEQGPEINKNVVALTCNDVINDVATVGDNASHAHLIPDINELPILDRNAAKEKAQSFIQIFTNDAIQISVRQNAPTEIILDSDMAATSEKSDTQSDTNNTNKLRNSTDFLEMTPTMQNIEPSNNADIFEKMLLLEQDVTRELVSEKQRQCETMQNGAEEFLTTEEKFIRDIEPSELLSNFSNNNNPDKPIDTNENANLEHNDNDCSIMFSLLCCKNDNVSVDLDSSSEVDWLCEAATEQSVRETSFREQEPLELLKLDKAVQVTSPENVDSKHFDESLPVNHRIDKVSKLNKMLQTDTVPPGTSTKVKKTSKQAYVQASPVCRTACTFTVGLEDAKKIQSELDSAKKEASSAKKEAENLRKENKQYKTKARSAEDAVAKLKLSFGDTGVNLVKMNDEFEELRKGFEIMQKEYNEVVKQKIEDARKHEREMNEVTAELKSAQEQVALVRESVRTMEQEVKAKEAKFEELMSSRNKEREARLEMEAKFTELEQQVNVERDRAVTSEVQMLEKKLAYGLSQLLHALSDAEKNFSKLDSMRELLKNQGKITESQRWDGVKLEWGKVIVTIKENMQKSKLLFQERIETVKNGTALANLPPIEVIAAPPPPKLPKQRVDEHMKARSESSSSHHSPVLTPHPSPAPTPPSAPTPPPSVTSYTVPPHVQEHSIQPVLKVLDVPSELQPLLAPTSSASRATVQQLDVPCSTDSPGGNQGMKPGLLAMPVMPARPPLLPTPPLATGISNANVPDIQHACTLLAGLFTATSSTVTASQPSALDSLHQQQKAKPFQSTDPQLTSSVTTTKPKSVANTKVVETFTAPFAAKDIAPGSITSTTFQPQLNTSELPKPQVQVEVHNTKPKGGLPPKATSTPSKEVSSTAGPNLAFQPSVSSSDAWKARQASGDAYWRLGYARSIPIIAQEHGDFTFQKPKPVNAQQQKAKKPVQSTRVATTRALPGHTAAALLNTGKADKPATQMTSLEKPRNIEKLMNQLETEFPGVPQSTFHKYIKEVRTSRGGTLSGISIGEIVKKVAERMHKAHLQAKEYAESRPKAWQNSTQDRGSNWSQKGDEDDCVICHDPMMTNSAAMLKCGHKFHSGCIRQWLKEQSTCPTCRVYALLSDEYPELSK